MGNQGQSILVVVHPYSTPKGAIKEPYAEVEHKHQVQLRH